MDIGAGEIAVIAILVLLFFGYKKIPEMARGLGAAKREFERGQAEGSAAAAKAEAEAEMTSPVEKVQVERVEADTATPAAIEATAPEPHEEPTAD